MITEWTSPVGHASGAIPAGAVKSPIYGKFVVVRVLAY
jgi:hypothetical protein